ncbi:MAG: hypothetical protein A2639_00075 [Candidatus Staskawiczbacteria bacterium RIFCSPHIGHO2_01_FULL_34_27]|nr:MAG: hypothetical protein A2639_00075 [Candidatus Staskawiczbacteria bacterium RIFCSPHIGHO2_01_FULL_34_27]
MLVRFLIEKALTLKIITKEQFSIENVQKFALRDDIWMWNILRGIESSDQYIQMVQEAVFYRKKKNILSLWKTRPTYHALQEKVAEKARRDNPLGFDKTITYEQYLSSIGNMDTPVLIFDIHFTPVEKNAVYLYSESKKELAGKNLSEVSKLISGLEIIWKDEPQYFVLLIGNNIRQKSEKMKEKWINKTAYFLLNVI